MSRPSITKNKRQEEFLREISKDPFLTDEELAELFKVSIPTIRLDRMELGIPELRERIRNVAEKNFQKVKALKASEMVGELIDIKLGKIATSIFETDESMTFEKTKIIQGKYIYSIAESLAIAVIDAHVALVGVANIKYSIPCYAGMKLTSEAEVKKVRGNKYIVWVKIKGKGVEIFRGKFILVSIEKA